MITFFRRLIFLVNPCPVHHTRLIYSTFFAYYTVIDGSVGGRYMTTVWIWAFTVVPHTFINSPIHHVGGRIDALCLIYHRRHLNRSDGSNAFQLLFRIFLDIIAGSSFFFNLIQINPCFTFESHKCIVFCRCLGQPVLTVMLVLQESKGPLLCIVNNFDYCSIGNSKAFRGEKDLIYISISCIEDIPYCPRS